MKNILAIFLIVVTALLFGFWGYIFKEYCHPVGDMNSDGKVDLQDLSILASQIHE